MLIISSKRDLDVCLTPLELSKMWIGSLVLQKESTLTPLKLSRAWMLRFIYHIPFK